MRHTKVVQREGLQVAVEDLFISIRSGSPPSDPNLSEKQDGMRDR